jgi:hypothetical protein
MPPRASGRSQRAAALQAQPNQSQLHRRDDDDNEDDAYGDGDVDMDGGDGNTVDVRLNTTIYEILTIIRSKN